MPDSGPSIPVTLILGIDAEYREKAAARKLKLIAPKLLNPGKGIGMQEVLRIELSA